MAGGSRKKLAFNGTQNQKICAKISSNLVRWYASQSNDTHVNGQSVWAWAPTRLLGRFKHAWRGTVDYKFRFSRSARGTEYSLEHLVFVHNNRPSCRRRRWTCDVEKQAQKIRLKNKTIIKWNARNTYRNVSKADAINWTNNSFAVLRGLLCSFCLLICLCIFTFVLVRPANFCRHVHVCAAHTHTHFWGKKKFHDHRLYTIFHFGQDVCNSSRKGVPKRFRIFCHSDTWKRTNEPTK